MGGGGRDAREEARHRQAAWACGHLRSHRDQVRDGSRGAIWYWGEGGATQCFTRGPGPVERPWYHNTEFPPYCEIPASDVRAAVKEFLRTARQPKCVGWQYDPAYTAVSNEPGS
ncbi:Imm1 family immunity protein [Saccharopolyspora shandongensis]|uniref:Imm1 family immunity protein n=1 Tax=Saccharopolyspora shandongensis TaxID=418495 RepID=UPI000B86434A